MSPLAFWVARRRELAGRRADLATELATHPHRAPRTFANAWQPWTWCRVTRTFGQRCQLVRGHHGRHATISPGGFDVRYFDAPGEGTP